LHHSRNRILSGLVLFPGIASLLLILCVAPGAYSFHEKGVARCEACHTMHSSEDGMPMDPQHPVATPPLLRFGSATTTCLSCHANEVGAVWGTNPLAPPPERGAGNFVFLREENINDAPMGTNYRSIPGSCSGHSVVAPELGFGPDPLHLTAPGGTYPSRELGCTSCHDPHGNDNYRLLYGVGRISAGDFYFSNAAPSAQGISLAGDGETATNHTAYLSGMSEWCANCHGKIHNTTSGFQHSVGGGFQHPVNEALTSEIAARYNNYGGVTNPNGGSPQFAYISQVPFEDPSLTISSTAGPTNSSRMNCMTCHRAHATSSPEAGRWDFSVNTLGDDGISSGSYAIPNPYNDPTQRQLCVKCHAQGEAHGAGQSCVACHQNSIAGQSCVACHRIHGTTVVRWDTGTGATEIK
jgi:hypothetical protein